MSETRERPILFSGPMVRAILDGREGRKLYPRQGETPTSPEHLARRLANGVSIDATRGCWLWQRTRNRFGYGTLTVSGRSRYAHRLAYELGVGAIPDGADVMHRCDEPRCINPEHLNVGTRSDNMRDCHRKGRSRIPKVRIAGEANGAAKLTAARVLEIRGRLAQGQTQTAVAAAFGISQSQVSHIARGLAWKELRP